MPCTLLVTNDFPPRAGGIQSYLLALADRLPAGELAVYAPSWPGAAEHDRAMNYPVHRHPGSLMLPTPAVARRACALAREHGTRTVWFGAAAPLALLGPALRGAGVDRIVASTHGHEVGWSMLPGARQALRRIGRGSDALTTISRYTRDRVAAAFGPGAVLEVLRSGVDATLFRPDPAARAELRRRYRLGRCAGGRLRVPAGAAQGSGHADPGPARDPPAGSGGAPAAGRWGPGRARLRRLAASCGVADALLFTGRVPAAELPAQHAVSDVFALPCRTHLGGLDVEGLGIAALEAAASGLPVVVGDSGGAPETVRHGETGYVVNGRDVGTLAAAVGALLADPDRARAMGAAGRRWMRRSWSWPDRVARLRQLLADRPAPAPPAPADRPG